MVKIDADQKGRTWNIDAKLFKMHKSWRNSFKRNIRSLKGYQILRITLVIEENHKDAGISQIVHHWIVQNFRLGRVFWRGYDHSTVSKAILPDQDSGQIHIATPSTAPSVTNWVLGVPGKVHTSSVGRSWKNKKDTLEQLPRRIDENYKT